MYNNNHINIPTQYNAKSRRKILEELEKIIQEMRIMGYRERTLYDYNYHLTKFIELNHIIYIDQVTRESIIYYISHNDVSPATRQIRAKVIKAVLNRFFDKRLFEERFWSDIVVKVPKHIKEGVEQQEINLLLSQLDGSNFTEYRDACVYMLLWENGVRFETLSNLTTDMINFNQKIINYPGKIMKNGQALSLPVSKQLNDMLMRLIQINQEVLNISTDYVFLTEKGNRLTNNAFGKRVALYKDKYDLKNINPHAIRRGFAKRLLDKGVSIPTISKALNHSSLEVTTQYLNIGRQEVIDSIRNSWEGN